MCREDRDSVLKAKGRLRNSSQYKNAYITQDYAKAIQMERKVLIKAMFLARKKGMKAKVVDRNLVVNNNVYNVGNIPDNLKESSTLRILAEQSFNALLVIRTGRKQIPQRY